jgi:hypothetical protein
MKRKFSDVVREMEARFRAEQREREACHREVMDGLVIPLLRAGLVDDVMLDEEVSSGATPLR